MTNNNNNSTEQITGWFAFLGSYAKTVEALFRTILWGIFVAGFIIAVFMIAKAAIKLIHSDEPSERVKAKQHIKWIVIALVIISLVTIIPGVLYEVIGKITNITSELNPDEKSLIIETLRPIMNM